MACKDCENIANSYDGKPFIPPGGLTNETYKCGCGQRWWRYNDYYHLWSKIDDDKTWQNVRTGCQEVVSIGSTSTNLSNLVEGGDEFA
jgi:hypothetical protein